MKKLMETLFRGWLVCVPVFLFLAVTPVAYAEYEIDTSSQDFSISVPPDGTIVQWTEDVVVSWPKPTMAGGDVLQGFVYKWNDSDESLDDTELNVNEGYNDGFVDPNVDPPVITKQAVDFAEDDSGDIRYLHIKTWFLDVSAGLPAYSDDVVIGPIDIDNVAPTGTVRITDSEGNDITTTYSTTVDVRLAASLGPTKVYLNESSTRPESGVTFVTKATYSFGDTGAKIIYAWFEDGVGNISSAPATDTVTILATVSISPYEGTFDLATVSTQVFAVDGNDDDYTWTIIDPTPSDVADFFGASTDTNSVTVTLLNPGTFKLQAAPAVGDALTSGTITVVELSVPKTYSLLTNVNAIVLCRTNSGYTTGAEFMSAIPNCVDLARWNATLQGYESWHAVFNPFELVVGEPYFVTVSSPADFTISGTIPTLSYSMLTNVNAISIPYDRSDITTGSQLISAIPNCVDLARWNATLQGYESWHAVFNPYDVLLYEAYFVTVSTPTTWP